MGRIVIQFQDLGGWRSAATLMYNASPQVILKEMRQASQTYRTERIRAVDQDDRLIDRL